MVEERSSCLRLLLEYRIAILSVFLPLSSYYPMNYDWAPSVLVCRVRWQCSRGAHWQDTRGASDAPEVAGTWDASAFWLS